MSATKTTPARRHFARDTRTMAVALADSSTSLTPRVRWMTEAEAAEYVADLNELDAMERDVETSDRWTIEAA